MKGEWPGESHAHAVSGAGDEDVLQDAQGEIPRSRGKGVVKAIPGYLGSSSGERATRLAGTFCHARLVFSMQALTGSTRVTPTRTYNLYGFTVASDLPLPCRINQESDCAVDVRIYHWEPSTHYFDSVRWVGEKYGRYLRAYDVGSYVLMCVGGDIQYLIHKDASAIGVAASRQSYYNAIQFAVGPPLAVNMMLRGIIPLHSAALEVNGRVYAMLGHSGIGKSTLLQLLLTENRDFKYVADDITPIMCDTRGIRGLPSVSLDARLWEDSLRILGLDSERRQEVYPGAEKFWVQVSPYRRVDEEVNVGALFVLSRTDRHYRQSRRTAVRRLSGSEALFQLFGDTHSVWALPPYLLGPLMPKYARVARDVPTTLVEVNYFDVQSSKKLAELIRETA